MNISHGWNKKKGFKVKLTKIYKTLSQQSNDDLIL